jgi:hypothetical protein
MQKFVMSAAIGLSFLAAAPSQAATVTNRDAKDYKLTVLEGDKSQSHTLKPSSVLQDVCPKGCIVRLNDSENDEYELEGTEIVSIEDGYLYYDVPDAVPGAPPAGSGAAGAAAPGATPPAGAPPASAPPASEPKKQ